MLVIWARTEPTDSNQTWIEDRRLFLHVMLKAVYPAWRILRILLLHDMISLATLSKDTDARYLDERRSAYGSVAMSKFAGIVHGTVLGQEWTYRMLAEYGRLLSIGPEPNKSATS